MGRWVTDTKNGEKVWIGPGEPTIPQQVFLNGVEDPFDAEIERILADDTPVTEADRPAILECLLGIADGRIQLLSNALKSSLDIMNAYRRMGYGDEVYMADLCAAIREGEYVLECHGVKGEK